MSTESFKMAFQRFQDLRGECVYLRSDHGSIFIGARNEEVPVNEKKAAENTIDQAKKRWNDEGKIWELNPPKASHMGGVWERKIGAIRQCIDAYMQQKQPGDRLLGREEFVNMLLHSARIVN